MRLSCATGPTGPSWCVPTPGAFCARATSKTPAARKCSTLRARTAGCCPTTRRAACGRAAWMASRSRRHTGSERAAARSLATRPSRFTRRLRPGGRPRGWPRRPALTKRRCAWQPTFWAAQSRLPITRGTASARAQPPRRPTVRSRCSQHSPAASVRRAATCRAVRRSSRTFPVAISCRRRSATRRWA